MDYKLHKKRHSANKHLPRGLEILYEDEDILVVDKPAGLLTVGTDNNKTNTAYYKLTDYVRKGNPKSRNRIFIVHRLDQSTSGALVFAKNPNAKFMLQSQWENTEKKYVAVVYGQLAKKEGLYKVFVTNGFMTEEMIDMAQPWLDAANIDLKSFNDDYYRKLCKGRLEPVLKSIEQMKKLGIWVEVTTLVVPGENDSEEEFKKIAEFLVGTDPAIPWHISRFYPQYQMDSLESTPMNTLNKAYEIGKESGLRYVYLGNVMGKGSDTECPQCGRVLIERVGFTIQKQTIKGGKCPHCQNPVDGIGF